MLKLIFIARSLVVRLLLVAYNEDTAVRMHCFLIFKNNVTKLSTIIIFIVLFVLINAPSNK